MLRYECVCVWCMESMFSYRTMHILPIDKLLVRVSADCADYCIYLWVLKGIINLSYLLRLHFSLVAARKGAGVQRERESERAKVCERDREWVSHVRSCIAHTHTAIQHQKNTHTRFNVLNHRLRFWIYMAL